MKHLMVNLVIFLSPLLWTFHAKAAHLTINNQTSGTITVIFGYYDINANQVVDIPDFQVDAWQTYSLNIGSDEADQRFFASYIIKGSTNAVYCHKEDVILIGNHTLEIKLTGNASANQVHCQSNR